MRWGVDRVGWWCGVVRGCGDSMCAINSRVPLAKDFRGWW